MTPEGSVATPVTCHEPFDLVTKASAAARASIDLLLGVLEQPTSAPVEEAPPPPKAKAKRKPKAAKPPAIDPDDIDF